MKRKTQIALLSAAITASSLLVWSSPGENHRPTIEGVWQVARGGVNCNDPNHPLESTFPAIMAFHHDGFVTGAAKSPVTGPFDTPEYGSWKREPGNQNYSFRELQYRYDGTGAFAGSLVLSANLELKDANNFVYNSTIEIIAPNGNVVASLCGRGIGTRFE